MIEMVDVSHRSLQEYYYGIIVKVLRDGTFSKLRLCPGCSKFFLAHRANEKSCCSECKDRWHNGKRQADGYFSNLRMKKQAENTPEQEKEIEARRLLEEGKDVIEIQERTGLSYPTIDQIIGLDPKKRRRQSALPKSPRVKKVVYALRQVLKILEIESDAERRQARRERLP